MKTLAILGSLALAFGATAQQRIIPQNFAWRVQPPGNTQYPIINDPNFVNIASIGVYRASEGDPVESANDLADLIEVDIANGKLAANGSNLTIILHGWGHDHESGTFEPEPDTRLYNPSIDTIPLNGDWPQPGGATTRAYVHPWLLSGIGTNPPLMQWTQTFMDEFADRVSNPSSNVPAPTRWYLDCEEAVALPIGRNGVFFLEQVATNGLSIHWANTPVPGYPLPGQTEDTAAELYAEAAGIYGWDTNIANEINSQFGAHEPVNQAVMAWWIQLSQRSFDATIKRCLYDIVHDAFPTCRVGNYGYSRYDGVNDTTGWFMDRDYPDEVSGDTRHEDNELPRGWIDRQWYGGEFWTVPGPFAEAGSGRWVIFPEWASGDVDSPYLYPINQQQYDGANGFSPGHGLANPYRPGQVESLIESALRLDRHAVESAINSYGGGNEDRLEPWVPFTLIQFSGNHQGEEELRPRLMMLRGKNPPARLIFTEEYQDVAAIRKAWFETHSLVQRVDAPYISEVKVLTGERPAASEEHNVEQLEYTLRVDGEPRTLDVDVETGPLSELVVEFYGLEVLAANFPAFEIRLEASTSAEEYYAFVAAFDFAAEEWVMVPQTQCDGDYYYDYPTPDQTCRATFFLGPAGGQEFVDENGRFLVKVVNVIDNGGVVRHDLLQVVRIREWGCSFLGGEGLSQGDQDYDGVSDGNDLDLYLTRYINGHAGADLNMDGNVDASDLTLFMNAWTDEND